MRIQGGEGGGGALWTGRLGLAVFNYQDLIYFFIEKLKPHGSPCGITHGIKIIF